MRKSKRRTRHTYGGPIKVTRVEAPEVEEVIALRREIETTKKKRKEAKLRRAQLEAEALSVSADRSRPIEAALPIFAKIRKLDNKLKSLDAALSDLESQRVKAANVIAVAFNAIKHPEVAR